MHEISENAVKRLSPEEAGLIGAGVWIDVRASA